MKAILFLMSCVHVLATFIPPDEIDFTPFQDAIKSALATSKTSDLVKPLTIESTSADCLIPDSAIMMTLSNFYSADLMALQHKAMDVWGMKECLESRFITVCLDVECEAICKQNSINNCVLLPIKTPASDILKEAFRFLSFLKHMLMYEALEIAKEVFFFDADVLLFRNPFPDTLYSRYKDGSRNLNSHPLDMMWQREVGGIDMGCGGAVNGGQLYLRKSSRVDSYFMYMFNLEDTLLNDKEKRVDQDFIATATAQAGMSTCALSPQLFTTHCFDQWDFNFGDKLMTDIVSFHAACLKSTVNKQAGMMHVYELVAANTTSNTLLSLKLGK